MHRLRSCVKICHQHCLELSGGKVRLQAAACLFGPGCIVLDRSRSARCLLGLGRHEHILGTLLLGWPCVSATGFEAKPCPSGGCGLLSRRGARFSGV